LKDPTCHCCSDGFLKPHVDAWWHEPLDLAGLEQKCGPRIDGIVPTHLEQSMQEEPIREALNVHWQASAAGDANAEHDIYDDNAICDHPQSGERILGRNNLQALRSHHPGKPSGFNVKRILGRGDLWITEYIITYQGRPTYTVSLMEFRNGKVVHETQYFADPFEAPDWRSQWVQRIA
jgi:hypothetical protein